MNKPANYQSLQQELETILSALQSSDVDIDEAIKLFEKGTKVLKELGTYLSMAENKIKIIKKSGQ